MNWFVRCCMACWLGALAACSGGSGSGDGSDTGIDAADQSHACTGSQTSCNGVCTDVSRDRENCGACGNACPGGQVCTMSHCAVACASGQTDCGGVCVSTMTDNANCGTCGAPCAGGTVCSNGVCSATCGAPLMTCTGTGSDGGTIRSCADTRVDPANCGSCGHACASGQQCYAGTCSTMCPTGTMACGGACASVATDNANCGACGNVCPAGNVCSMGVCQLTCAAPLVRCGGGDGGSTGPYCANTQIDPMNCGTCGTACPAGQQCVAGTCGLACAAGQTVCGSGPLAHCTNLQSDNANCGLCATACAAGTSCQAGACAPSCPTGQSACGTGASARCVDLTSDSANCGTCGTACASGFSCQSSTCAPTCASGLTACGSGSSALCVSLLTDNVNCGSCGHVCAAGTMCSAGACATTCASPLTACGTPAACTNLQSDPASCGFCGNRCATAANASPVCASGSCGVLCTAGFGDCDGSATNGCESALNTTTNCGTCGHACRSGSVCRGGTCVVFNATVPPVTISPAGMSCTTQTSNGGRKIGADASGMLYVAMSCGGSLYVTRSGDGGITWSIPIALGVTGVSEIAVEGGPASTAYIEAIAGGNAVFTRSLDAGATWSPPVTLAPGVGAGASVASQGDNVYVGALTGGSITVFRNAMRGSGAFASTAVTLSGIAFWDVSVDHGSGAVWVTSDTPALHLRESTDGAVTFAPEVVQSASSAFYSDWSSGGGFVFAVGVSPDNAFRIPEATPGTSTTIGGLVAGVPQQRAVSADSLGDAYVVSATGPNVVLQRVRSTDVAAPAPVMVGVGTFPAVVAPAGYNNVAAMAFTSGTTVQASVVVF